MSGLLSMLYALACYVCFFGTFLYMVGFVGGLVVPKAIDAGPATPPTTALFINTLLLGVFALQHSVMARHAFKRLWTRLVPPAVERSTYVLASSLALILLMWQWRPMTSMVWQTSAPLNVLLIQLLFWFGWIVALVSTFLLDHFELFGLRQAYARMMNRTRPATAFKTPLFYRYVRHPLYVGFLLAFWSAPTMTIGHLMFAIAMTAYIFIGIWFEERDLIEQFGARYQHYRTEVGALVPRYFHSWLGTLSSIRRRG